MIRVSTQNESKAAKIDSSILEACCYWVKCYKRIQIQQAAGATAATLSSVEASKKWRNRKKLTKLSAEMGEYLAKKAAGLPNTDSAHIVNGSDSHWKSRQIQRVTGHGGKSHLGS